MPGCCAPWRTCGTVILAVSARDSRTRTLIIVSSDEPYVLNFVKYLYLKFKMLCRKKYSLLSFRFRFRIKINQILTKNPNFVKNSNFGQKSKFWTKSHVLAKNPDFGQISNIWSKIQILVKIKVITQKSKLSSKIRFTTRILILQAQFLRLLAKI